MSKKLKSWYDFHVIFMSSYDSDQILLTGFSNNVVFHITLSFAKEGFNVVSEFLYQSIIGGPNRTVKVTKLSFIYGTQALELLNTHSRESYHKTLLPKA